VFYLDGACLVRGESVPTAAEALRVRSRRSVTGEFGPEPQYWVDDVQVFRKHPAQSEEDSQKGRICTRSKMWFPAHRIVIVGGLPYGDVFAPRPSRRGIGGLP
jgi:hypothetical protein